MEIVENTPNLSLQNENNLNIKNINLEPNIIEQDIRLESYGTLSDIICNSEKVDSTFDLFVTPSDSDCDLIPIS